MARGQLLDAMNHRDDLAVVDDDFLTCSLLVINRGFLVLKRHQLVDPGALLEKIIRYEAVLYDPRPGTTCARGSIHPIGAATPSSSGAGR